MADSVDLDSDRATGTATGPTGTTGGGRSTDPNSDALRRLAEDWITLWQSELTALAADREAREAWQTTLDLWAGFATSIIRSMPRAPATAGPGAPQGTSQGMPQGMPQGTPPHDGPARQSGPDAAARPPPSAAAPDARDAEIQRLGRHIADLESRLAELERGRRPRRTRQPKR